MWQMVFSKNGHKNNSSPTYSLRNCHCPTNRGSVSSAMEHRVRCGVDLDGCLDEQNSPEVTPSEIRDQVRQGNLFSTEFSLLGVSPLMASML